MNRCPSCGAETGDADQKCRACGAVLSGQQPSLLAEIAGSEIKLRTLLLDLPGYARRFHQLLRSPGAFFSGVDHAGQDAFRQGLAFMLQGVTLAFLLLTLSLTLPQAITSSYATSLLWVSQEDLLRYSSRVQAVRDALPAGLARDWLTRAEMVLTVRVLPEEQFRHVLGRIRALGGQNPGLLERTVTGALTFRSGGGEFGGRAYVLSFFMGLDPYAGPLLDQTRDLAQVGPRFELKPHVDFLLRNLLLWYLAGFAITRALPRRPGGHSDRPTLLVGAYVVGLLSPMYHAYLVLLNTYLAATLPLYIQAVGRAAMDVGSPDLGALSGGTFPFEQALVLGVQLAARFALVGAAVALCATGLQRAYGVSKARAWSAAGVGIAIGLAGVEAVASVLRLVLAPTGLV